MIRILFAVALMALPGMSVAQDCPEIRFARGAYSGVVQGVVPGEGIDCYIIGTGANQTMRISVTGRNMAFGIDGVTDGQDDFSLRTRAGYYGIRVYQLFRSVTPEGYTLTVTIR